MVYLFLCAVMMVKLWALTVIVMPSTSQ